MEFFKAIGLMVMCMAIIFGGAMGFAYSVQFLFYHPALAGLALVTVIAFTLIKRYGKIKLRLPVAFQR